MSNDYDSSWQANHSNPPCSFTELNQPEFAELKLDTVQRRSISDNLKPLPGAWLVVALLWVVAALNYLDRLMITTMRGSLVETIPMTEAQFGLLTSVFLWVYGALSPMAGFLADRFSRGRIIIGSVLVWSVVTWLTGKAQTFEELLIARALMGISEACYIPAALALIADYHRGTTRSLATGIHMNGIYVGSALGGLGGWLAQRNDWSFAFQLFGLVGIVYSLLLAVLLRDVPRVRKTPDLTDDTPNINFLEATTSLLSNYSFLVILVFWSILGLSGWVIVGWMPTFLNEHFHLDQGTAGLSATGYMQCASMVGVLIGGAWADRWSRTNQRGRIIVPMLGLLFAAPAVLLAAKSNLLTLTLAGLVLYGLTFAFTAANMMPILCLVSDERYRATGYGVLNLFACLVGGVATYIGGVLRDSQVDLSHIFQFAAGSLVLSAILLGVLLFLEREK